jgi:hypothetical protein
VGAVGDRLHHLRDCYGRLVRVVASPEAVEFIRARGGRLWVWPRHPVRPGLVTLEAATERPHGELAFVATPQESSFELFFDARGWGEPDFLEIDLRGRRRQRVVAFWNGLAYLQ